MSDAARLACQWYTTKPAGTPYSSFTADGRALQEIIDKVPEAIVASSYSALISYTEAMSGLKSGSSSWSVVRLYYSCFYSIRAMLLANGVVPFNCGTEMILETSTGRVLRGGRSSHHWNWTSINSTGLRGEWLCSEDSQTAYDALRKHRENVNYTHGFTDPNLHSCLISQDADLARRFRAYRDDTAFLYTYLVDHLAIAYPTKLIFRLDHELRDKVITIPEDKATHAKSLWKIRDRCPLI